jgi:cobalt-zinc-cadmium efflux system outer membrane protein
MFCAVRAIAAACLFAGVPGAAVAQTVLTLEETLARARDQAGAVVVSRARIAEAEASLLGASARLRDNPLMEAAAGPRSGGGTRSADLELGLSQHFETGGQRQARIAGARAGIERQRAEVQQTARNVAFDAASAFLDGIAATERLRVAEEADTVARELLNASERRYAFGDIAAIDLNLARIGAARSAANLVSARADLTAAAGVLRALLRLPIGEPIELRGSLDVAPLPPIDGLAAFIDQRPEFGVLEAEAREAEAQAQLGSALRSPDLGFRVAYKREEPDTILLGGLTVTFPVFQRGQGTLAAGQARANRARLEVETARQSASTELRTAYAVYEQRAALAADLQRNTIPSLADNETLGRRSYEAGEMNLMDFLLIRRDALDTRMAVIDKRLEAARSRLTVDFVAGVLR